MPQQPETPKRPPGTPPGASSSPSPDPPAFQTEQAARPRRTTDWGSLAPSGGPLHGVDAVLGVTRVRPVTLMRTGTVSERRAPDPPPPAPATSEAEHLSQVAQVLERAQEVLGSEEAALAWFRSAHPGLAGQAPRTVMGTAAGLAQVWRLLPGE